MNNVQFCPICKSKVEYSSRYPGYLCQSCVDRITDKKGNALSFGNTEIFGYGCSGIYQETQKTYNSNICYVDGFKCKADAAYFGGIVIQPNEYWQDSHPSSSLMQKTAESFLLMSLNSHIEKNLISTKLQLTNNISVQIDGIDFSGNAVCEIYARLGRLKGSQPDKIASDILKMLTIERLLSRNFDKHLVFASKEASSTVTGQKWLAKTVKEYDIHIHTFELPTHVQESLLQAQKKQKMVNETFS